MPCSILHYFLLQHVTDEKTNIKKKKKVNALVLIKPEACFPRFLLHRIFWLNNIKLILIINISKGKFSSFGFRFASRSNYHPSSSSCLCPGHSVGSGGCRGLVPWRWSCHHRWNRFRRCQTHRRDCHCGSSAQNRPPPEVTLEVLNVNLAPIWRKQRRS